MGDTERLEIPFVDMSNGDPTAVNKRMGTCRGSSKHGGKCTAMDLSFDSIDEWREHRAKHHPVDCGESGCSILSAYKRDNAPLSYCYKHIPNKPNTVYAWKRTNTRSVVEPPRADKDHPIEAVLPAPSTTDTDRSQEVDHAE
jgi:hypothetical protein